MWSADLEFVPRIMEHFPFRNNSWIINQNIILIMFHYLNCHFWAKVSLFIFEISKIFQSYLWSPPKSSVLNG